MTGRHNPRHWQGQRAQAKAHSAGKGDPPRPRNRAHNGVHSEPGGGLAGEWGRTAGAWRQEGRQGGGADHGVGEQGPEPRPHRPVAHGRVATHHGRRQDHKGAHGDRGESAKTAGPDQQGREEEAGQEGGGYPP